MCVCFFLERDPTNMGINKNQKGPIKVSTTNQLWSLALLTMIFVRLTARVILIPSRELSHSCLMDPTIPTSAWPPPVLLVVKKIRPYATKARSCQWSVIWTLNWGPLGLTCNEKHWSHLRPYNSHVIERWKNTFVYIKALKPIKP